MFAVQFAMQSTHRKNQQAYAYNSIGEIECRRLGAHLSFCHHQQLGHFRALAGAEVLLHLELLLQLEDLAAREGGPRLLLPPGVRGARVGVVLRGLQSTVGAARIGVLMLGLGGRCRRAVCGQQLVAHQAVAAAGGAYVRRLGHRGGCRGGHLLLLGGWLAGGLCKKSNQALALLSQSDS